MPKPRKYLNFCFIYDFKIIFKQYCTITTLNFGKNTVLNELIIGTINRHF